MKTCVRCRKPRKNKAMINDSTLCIYCYRKRQSKIFALKNNLKNPPVKGGERRKNIRRNGGFYTKSEWQSLKKKYDYTCLACGKKEPDIRLQADHVIPVAVGGTSWISNIQPLCQKCNCKKGTDIIDYRKKWEKKNEEPDA